MKRRGPGPLGARTLIPTCCAADMLTMQDAAIARIRVCFGIDAAAFESQILPIIRRLSGYLLKLAATKDAYYGHPGGMFEFALAVGFFALQGTDAYIFAGRSTISIRRHLEPRWRLATFIAGLLTVLERTAGQVVVEDGAGGRWPALVVPLSSWLQSRSASGYYQSWLAGPREVSGIGLFALPLVVPTDTLLYLSDGNEEVLPALLASVAGIAHYRDHNPLPKLVRRAVALVVHDWTEKSCSDESAQDHQAHLQNYTLEAMRRLAASHPRWVPNRDKSRVWIGSDGAYVVWPQSAADIAGCFDEEELAGMPRSAEAIHDLLNGVGALQPGQNPTSTLWLIQPPVAAGPVEAIKLTSSAVLFPFDAVQPDPLGDTLACQRPTHTPVSPRHGLNPGAQLDLALAESTPSGTSQDARPAWEARNQRAAVRTETTCLRPPLRLDRTIAEAVERFFQRLTPTIRTALFTPDGVFVPNSSFRDVGLDAALAIAGMDAAGMLVRGSDGRPRTSQHEVDGMVVDGVLVQTQFLRGS